MKGMTKEQAQSPRHYPEPTAEEYQQAKKARDASYDDEVIKTGPFAGRCVDWDCDMNYDQRAVAHQEAYNAYYQRMEDDAIDRACGDYERKHEDTWPEA